MYISQGISDNFLKTLTGFLLLLGLCFLPAYVSAESPWVIVHPGNPAHARIKIVHFRDTHTGWAAGFAGQTMLLRTTDGGLTWQEEWTDFPYYQAFFINPLEGWTFSSGPKPLGGAESIGGTPLMEDIELYHSTDGGLSWQLQRGKITGITNISDLESARPFELKYLRRLYFIDAQRGWLLGYVNGEEGKTTKWVAGNLFLFTNDGGKTWKGQIDVYPSVRLAHIGPPETTIRVPIDIDFVSYTDGWILAAEKWLYRTTDGGKTWERLEHNRIREWQYIDFVDTQHGWLTGAGFGDNITGVLFTQDGGNTWAQKAPILRGSYVTPYFVNVNEGWVVGTESPLVKEWRIFYTTDGGNTWQPEWQTQQGKLEIFYLRYDAATKSLWAGGTMGVLLKRLVNIPVPSSITPKGKLSTFWGKVKKGIL